ncbi:protein FAM133B-like [Mercenaria mercenaria]|uniref:protein FAM133B-like n=1 Tax=Mercenaria mercenaria TaxID=6596 RepID=UPI00234EF1AE|nr:protein FAM133B-like [Mercenaria mercenaria]
MSGSESRKTNRSTVRHDYKQISEIGIEVDTAENPLGISSCIPPTEGARPRLTSEDTLQLLECEYKSLVQEQEQLQREALIAKMRKKVDRKKKEIAELRGESILVDNKVSLQDLKKDKKKLRSKAKKTLKETGLCSESSINSSDIDSSESNNDDPVNEKEKNKSLKKPEIEGADSESDEPSSTQRKRKK